jgi:hypothetical protein
MGRLVSQTLVISDITWLIINTCSPMATKTFGCRCVPEIRKHSYIRKGRKDATYIPYTIPDNGE